MDCLGHRCCSWKHSDMSGPLTFQRDEYGTGSLSAWLWQKADNKFHSCWLLGTSSASLCPAPRGWVFPFSLCSPVSVLGTNCQMSVYCLMTSKFSLCNQAVVEMHFKRNLFLISAMLFCVTFPLMFALWRRNVDVGSVKISIFRNVFVFLI